MKYWILRTDKANDQLYAIIRYIADDSGSVDIALRYLDVLEKAILNLEDDALSGELSAIQHSKKARVSRADRKQAPDFL